MIIIRFFASLREALGVSSLEYELYTERNVLDLKQSLLKQDEKWRLLLDSNVLVAVNQTLSAPDAAINDGDEVAFFPPVTGG